MAFNQLSADESERLALLLEELGEAIQIVGKTLRHGYESTHLDYGGVTNRLLLTKELGDVMAAVELMQRAQDVAAAGILFERDAKLEKVQRYLHHQPSSVA